ncbi:MAG: zf-HC2 domain-containing protein [Thermoanaerobaculia bacterium]
MRHQDVWEVLPWFVNGSLEDQELEQVERHLAGCEECRHEASELQQIARIMVGAGASMVMPDEAFPELLSKIEEAERRDSAPWGRWLRPDGWPRRLLLASSAGPFLRPVLAAGLVVIALLAAILWRQTAPAPPETFRTLSDPVPVVESTGLQVRMVFSSEVDEGTLRSLLLEVGGQIVGGPSPYGVYTVELSAKEDPTARAKLLEEIRARREVEFLEPVSNE